MRVAWRVRTFLLGLALLATVSLNARAAQDELTAEQVGAWVPYMMRMHVLKPKYDVAFMRIVLKKFMEHLDPMRTIYLASEIDDKVKIPDEKVQGLMVDLLKGDETFFADMIKERQDKFLQRDKDFYDKLEDHKAEILAKVPREELDKIKFDQPPATNEDRLRRVIIRLSQDYHLFRDYLSEADAFKYAIDSVRRSREKGEKLDPLTDTPKTVLKSVMLALDPHSEYMDADDMDQFDADMARSFAGIGVQIRGCPQGAQVEEVIKDSPAFKSGRFDPGDQIVAVDEQVLAGLNLNQIVKKIKGPRQTEVSIGLRKLKKTGDGYDVETVKLTRDKIELSELKVVGKKFDTDAGPVGAITVQNFYPGVSADVAERIKQLSVDKPLAGLILDLRGNSGGMLDEAVKLSGLFIGSGNIVAERDNRGEVTWLQDPDEATVFSGPLVMLVSQFSASASEIVTGTLRDYGRAIVVGPTQTHGKGSVQRIMRFTDAKIPGQFKLTVQQYFLAGGDSTQLRGVEPDIVIPGMKLIEELLEKGYEGAIPWASVPSGIPEDHPDFRKYTRLKTAILPILKENSAKRVAENKDFDIYKKDKAAAENGANPEVPKGVENPPKPEDPKTVEAPKLENPKDPKVAEGDDPKNPKSKKDKKDPQMDEAVQIVKDIALLWGKELAK